MRLMGETTGRLAGEAKEKGENRGAKKKRKGKEEKEGFFWGERSLPEEEGMRKGVTVKGGISGIIPINYLLIFVLMPFFSFC